MALVVNLILHYYWHGIGIAFDRHKKFVSQLETDTIRHVNHQNSVPYTSRTEAEAFLMAPDLQLSARPHHYQKAPQNLLIDVRKDKT